MNTQILNAINQIVTQNGKGVLDNSKLVNLHLAQHAPNEPKPLRRVLVKGLMNGYHRELEHTAESARPQQKAALARHLHDDTGTDLDQCAEAIDILETVIFGKSTKAPEPAAPPPQAQPQPVIQNTQVIPMPSPKKQTSPEYPAPQDRQSQYMPQQEIRPQPSRELKCGEFRYIRNSFDTLSGKSKGELILFTDHLEWHGHINFGIAIDDISRVKIDNNLITIHLYLNDGSIQKFQLIRKIDFNLALSAMSKDHATIGALYTREALELESWRSAIEQQRGRL